MQCNACMGKSNVVLQIREEMCDTHNFQLCKLLLGEDLVGAVVLAWTVALQHEIVRGHHIFRPHQETERTSKLALRCIACATSRLPMF